MRLSKFTYEYVSKSIERGVIKDINAVIPVLGGSTLLHIASFNNDQKLVDYLLRKGADINSKSRRWGTVFNFALIMNNLTTIQSLISFGAVVNHRIEFSELSRFEKAVYQYYEEIRKFSSSSFFFIHTMFLFDHTAVATLPLNIAIHGQNVKMVELLLKNNADPNPDADTYGSPLIFAAIKGDLQIIKLLLAHGSNVNIVMKHVGGIPHGWKESPLHVVAHNQNSKALKLFLDHDMIDINTVTDFKDSALHCAMRFPPDDNIIRQLLNAGIDVNLKNSDGKTAFNTSTQNNSKKVNDTITEHIAKCSAANFYVNEENLAVINSEKFGELRGQCISQIEKMKITFVGKSNVTYHYVIKNKCVHKLALSLKYVSVSILLDSVVQSMFPLYAGIINYRLKKAFRRKKLLFNAVDLIDDICQELQLPSTFTRDIFKLLSNEDLKKLQ